MRGSKLMAWHVPLIMRNLQGEANAAPEGSNVPGAQRQLLAATRATLSAIGADVRAGLLETVGIESKLAEGERASIVLELPSGTDTESVARAIDMENVEAWCDEEGRVHVAISPWYSTKDVDQTVLSIIKVVHVLLGLHASDQQGARTQPKGLVQRFLASMLEIMLLQKRFGQEKEPPAK